MFEIIMLIIIGIWGCIGLIGMTLIKLEREKAECWAWLNYISDCENKEEREEN